MENKLKFGIPKMNKKGWILRDWVIASILFSAVIALFVLQSTDLGITYEVTNATDDEFAQKFNKFEENTNLSKEMWDKTSGEEGLSTVGTYEILFKSTVGVISLVFTSVKNAGSQIFGFLEYFGVDRKVIDIIGIFFFAVISIIIIFVVLSSVSRRDI